MNKFQIDRVISVIKASADRLALPHYSRYCIMPHNLRVSYRDDTLFMIDELYDQNYIGPTCKTELTALVLVAFRHGGL